jgi:MPBQ/MSBQ methyltransferase
VSREARTAYDVIGHYDDAYFDDLARRYRERRRFARRRITNVLRLLPGLAGRRFLDVGCGMGTFAIEAARLGAHAVGLDLTAQALAAARRVAGQEGVRRVAFVRADAARLPFRDGSFDVVLAADLTEHLDDATLAAVLGEARRVLRPEGELVIYTPDADHVLERLRRRGLLRQDPSHIGVRTARQVAEAVAAAGFSVARAGALPSHVPVLDIVERSIGPWVPLLRRRVGLVARRAE